MPPKKFVSQREREEILQNFIENLENDDDGDIFERTDIEEDCYEKVDIENIDININTNEIIDKPVDTSTNWNNECHSNM